MTDVPYISQASNMPLCHRAAASRLADRKDEIAAVPATDPTPPHTGAPTLQKSSSSSRRISGEPGHHSKAAAFLLKNPKASVSMLRRSPSSQKGSGESVATSSTRGEAGASPFELAQVSSLTCFIKAVWLCQYL